jgi:hypothetical protein
VRKARNILGSKPVAEISAKKTIDLKTNVTKQSSMEAQSNCFPGKNKGRKTTNIDDFDK